MAATRRSCSASAPPPSGVPALAPAAPPRGGGASISFGETVSHYLRIARARAARRGHTRAPRAVAFLFVPTWRQQSGATVQFPSFADDMRLEVLALILVP